MNQETVFTLFWAILFCTGGGVTMWWMLQELEGAASLPFEQETPEERRKRMMEEYSRWRY